MGATGRHGLPNRARWAASRAPGGRTARACLALAVAAALGAGCATGDGALEAQPASSSRPAHQTTVRGTLELAGDRLTVFVDGPAVESQPGEQPRVVPMASLDARWEASGFLARPPAATLRTATGEHQVTLHGAVWDPAGTFTTSVAWSGAAPPGGALGRGELVVEGRLGDCDHRRGDPPVRMEVAVHWSVNGGPSCDDAGRRLDALWRQQLGNGTVALAGDRLHCAPTLTPDGEAVAVIECVGTDGAIGAVVRGG